MDFQISYTLSRFHVKVVRRRYTVTWIKITTSDNEESSVLLVEKTNQPKLAFNTKTDNLFVLANLQRAFNQTCRVFGFEVGSKNMQNK